MMYSSLYSFKLRGIVYDNFNQILSNVSIVLSENKKVLSDFNGQFFIDNLKGIYMINVNHIGYDGYKKEINISDDIFLDIILEEKALNLDRIVVTGTRGYRHIKDSPVITHIISNNDIQNSPYSTAKEILEVAMPNVQMVASNHGDDRVKFQGLDNKYMTFLIDGDRISGEFAGNIDFSMFNLDNIEKIEIVEGAMSILYGSSAIGGVVNFITKKRKNPFWFDLSITHDKPLADSKFMNLGFNKNNLYYNLEISHQQSDGYDLTLQSEFSKTLEEYLNYSWQHTFRYSINDAVSLEYMNKNYGSDINDYASVTYFDDNFNFVNQVIYDAPLSRYADKTNKVKYLHSFGDYGDLKMVLINEKYIKKYYYPYYNNSQNDYMENGKIFNHGILRRKEFIAHYNYETSKHKRLFGFEYAIDSYGSFNILDNNSSMLFESIFNGVDEYKDRIDAAIFLNNEWMLPNNDELTFGIRYTNDENLLTSLIYLLRGNKQFNTRFSYSSGYRKPSLKELYYEWIDHDPHVYGNPDLEPTSNDYFSISVDKRTLVNDFSVVFYYNDIKNMISTDYEPEGLFYKNYKEVVMYGYNVHYSRKINQSTSMKFVYNYTKPSSKSDEILEGISEHSFRVNFFNEIIPDKLKLILNIKYGGEKFNFDQVGDASSEEDFVGNPFIKILDDYFLVDLIFASQINSTINLKYGLKNVFNYKDDTRFDQDASNILNNYDPGRRWFLEMNLKFGKGIDDV